jgi:mannosyl-3-phosphoglycerate phosphatase
VKIIFTDLDGTLLDHHGYSFDGAKEALTSIERLHVPLIIVTSKTYSEVVKLQKSLKLFSPFIIENGAGLYIPENYHYDIFTERMERLGKYRLLAFGKSMGVIREFISQNLSNKIEGFSDMSLARVRELTGLGEEEAKLSMDREFTEPFLLKDGVEIDEVLNIVENSPFKVTKGGRFYHLMGEEQDKGRAVKETISLYMRAGFEKMVSYALGDGKNDEPMLKSVDFPFLMKRYNGTFEDLLAPNLQFSEESGSAGWNRVVMEKILELRD